MKRSKRPYRLPTPLTCDPARVANGVTMEIVGEYIRKHEYRMPRYVYLENLYKGFHDIYHQPEKEEWKPDNRLAVNFPRYITETFVGYGYGIPIRVTSPDDAVNDKIQEFGRDNEITDHNAEMVRLISVYGHAFEYYYQDEQAKTKLTAATPKELFVVYDDTLKDRALFAIRYGRHSLDTEMLGGLYGEIMTPGLIETFDGMDKKETIVNPYGYINCVEWRLNDDRMGLYEPVAGLVETYNAAIGEKANDVDAFAEAYLEILGADVDEPTLKDIRDNRFINLFGTADPKDVLVQFMQKPTADATQENLLNRLENLIYQTSMVANLSDKDFGSATSGTALAYKLQAMSNLAVSVDRKIEKSLRKRYKIFCTLSTNTPSKDAWRDLEFKMTRNIPKNVAEETEAAAQAEGIVSRRTQLSLLSYVPDPDAEIDRMDKEEEDAQKKQQVEFGKNYFGNGQQVQQVPQQSPKQPNDPSFATKNQQQLPGMPKVK